VSTPGRDLHVLVYARRHFHLTADRWRHLGPRHDPLSGEGARLNGGRFNPVGSVPASTSAVRVPASSLNYGASASDKRSASRDSCRAICIATTSDSIACSTSRMLACAARSDSASKC
jgi:RES domain-containing protein